MCMANLHAPPRARAPSATLIPVTRGMSSASHGECYIHVAVPTPPPMCSPSLTLSAHFAVEAYLINRFGKIAHYVHVSVRVCVTLCVCVCVCACVYEESQKSFEGEGCFARPGTGSHHFAPHAWRRKQVSSASQVVCHISVAAPTVPRLCSLSRYLAAA